MLTVIGDLVEDVVAVRDGVLERGTDNPGRIVRARGGSGANVAAAAAGLVPTRFIGCVGADDVGERLQRSLEAAGVDTRLQRTGETGTVIAVVDRDGERTFLTDRGAAAELTRIEPSWLAGTTWLHLPLYGLHDEASRDACLDACEQVVRWGARVSVDLSSVASIRQIGVATLHALLARISPAVVFANDAEAHESGLRDVAAIPEILVKHGAAPVEIVHRGATVLVPVEPVDGVTDTTGAGDAFAAGYLTSRIAGATPVDAARAGSRLAALTLRTAGAGAFPRSTL